MRVRSGLPLGVNASFFDDARRTRALESTLSSYLLDRDFHEVLLPILDYYEPYKSLLADGADVATGTGASKADQLYRFVDRDGQLLALRHDFTPMLARLVAPRVKTWDLPVRLFYRGDVVRFQEPRPGLLRESAQLGAEILDVPTASHEQGVLERFVELLLLGCNGGLAQAASQSQVTSKPDTGQPTLQIVLGLANALEPLIAGADDPAAAARAIVKRDRAATSAIGPELMQTVVHGVPDDFGVLGEAASDLEEILALSEALQATVGASGVQVSVDLAEFQDFGSGQQEGEHPYYQGLVFRAYRSGSAQPVGNGGRYDGLFARLGADVSAAGFSIGLDQLLAASRQSKVVGQTGSAQESDGGKA